MTDASTSYTMSIVNNVLSSAQYTNYYNEMRSAEVDNQLESNSIGLLTEQQPNDQGPSGITGLYGTYKGIFAADRAIHMGIGSITASLATLAPGIIGSGQGAQLINDAMGATILAMGVNSAIRAAVEAQGVIEGIELAIEIAIASVQPWMWPVLAAAAAASAFVTYELESMIDHPSVTVNADISTPLGIRQVSQTMSEAASAVPSGVPSTVTSPATQDLCYLHHIPLQDIDSGWTARGIKYCPMCKRLVALDPSRRWWIPI